jgi:hypothetical protein
MTLSIVIQEFDNTSTVVSHPLHVVANCVLSIHSLVVRNCSQSVELIEEGGKLF